MKKTSESRIVKVFTRIINIRDWFDWDRVKAFTIYLANGFRRLFVPQKTTDVESFDEAMKRLGISEQSLLAKQKALFRLAILMLAAAGLMLVYLVYQIFFGSYKAVILSIVVILIAFTLAFRYHFWYFQIKHRKLGCSFIEWFRQGLLGEKE